MQPKIEKMIELDDTQHRLSVLTVEKGVKQSKPIKLLEVEIYKNHKLGDEIAELKATINLKNSEIETLTQKLLALDEKSNKIIEAMKLQNESIKAITDKLNIEGRI